MPLARAEPVLMYKTGALKANQGPLKIGNNVALYLQEIEIYLIQYVEDQNKLEKYF